MQRTASEARIEVRGRRSGAACLLHRPRPDTAELFARGASVRLRPLVNGDTSPRRLMTRCVAQCHRLGTSHTVDTSRQSSHPASSHPASSHPASGRQHFVPVDVPCAFTSGFVWGPMAHGAWACNSTMACVVRCPRNPMAMPLAPCPVVPLIDIVPRRHQRRGTHRKPNLSVHIVHIYSKAVAFGFVAIQLINRGKKMSPWGGCECAQTREPRDDFGGCYG